MSVRIMLIEEVLADQGYECLEDQARFENCFVKHAEAHGFNSEEISDLGVKIPAGINPESFKSLVEEQGISRAIEMLAGEKEYTFPFAGEKKRTFWQKLNYLPIFNPSLIPHREIVSRVTMLLVMAVFIYRKLHHFHFFPSKVETFAQLAEMKTAPFTCWALDRTAWFLDGFIFIGYIIAYLTRDKAKSVANGFMEVVYPFIIAGIPILISFTRYPNVASVMSKSIQCHKLLLKMGIDSNNASFGIWVMVVVLVIMVLGTTLNVIGLFYLRRSFTLMAEARTLIQKGPFRIFRHPLYTAHFVMFLGTTLFRFHWITVAMYLIFLVGQYYRATIEERKLAAAFPEYGLYKRNTGMFFPRFSRPKWR